MLKHCNALHCMNMKLPRGDNLQARDFDLNRQMWDLDDLKPSQECILRPAAKEAKTCSRSSRSRSPNLRLSTSPPIWREAIGARGHLMRDNLISRICEVRLEPFRSEWIRLTSKQKSPLGFMWVLSCGLFCPRRLRGGTMGLRLAGNRTQHRIRPWCHRWQGWKLLQEH